MEDKEYLPASQASKLTQEEIDKAMPAEKPAASEEEILEPVKFEENDIIDGGGFVFEVTKVMGNNRYLIKVLE